MAIESAVASNNAAALTTPNVRRDEPTSGTAPLSAPRQLQLPAHSCSHPVLTLLCRCPRRI